MIPHSLRVPHDYEDIVYVSRLSFIESRGS